MVKRPVLQEVPDTIFLQAFDGLKNTVTAERLGSGDFQVAKNVDIDDSKQVHRRRGYVLKDAGVYHSLYESSRKVYVVKDGDLGILYPNYTFVSLQDDVGSQKVSYVEVSDTLYWSNLSTSGKIDMLSDTASGWGTQGAGTWLSPVLQPTDTLGVVAGKLLGAPPLAEYMIYFNGRIYLARDKTIWCTELFLYDYIDKTRTFIQMEAEITGLGVVGDGIYVGTTLGCYFLSGPFGEMRKTPATQVAVTPGSMIKADPEDYPKTPTTAAVLFMSTNGLCVGADGGVCRDLTDGRVWFPDAVSAAALLRKQDGVMQYVGVIDSGGSPTSSARIGDYAEATIVRFQG